MIIETRVYNKRTGKMVYFEPLKPHTGHVMAMSKSDPVLVLDETDPIMLKTPILSADNWHLWEGDICECGVVTSFGLIKELGIVVWRGDKGGFVLEIGKSFEGNVDFHVKDIHYKGNLYEHPELFNQFKKSIQLPTSVAEPIKEKENAKTD